MPRGRSKRMRSAGYMHYLYIYDHSMWGPAPPGCMLQSMMETEDVHIMYIIIIDLSGRTLYARTCTI